LASRCLRAIVAGSCFLFASSCAKKHEPLLRKAASAFASASAMSSPPRAIAVCEALRSREEPLVLFSHSGTRVAMARPGELWIFDLSTAQATLVSQEGDRDGSVYQEQLVWSPDDGLLAFVSATPPGRFDFELWDTCTMARLTKQPGQVGMAPTFASDGAVVAFTGRLGDPPERPYPDRPTLALYDIRTRTVIGAITVDPPDSGSKESDVWDHSGEPQPRQVVFGPALSWAAVRWGLDRPPLLWDLAHSRQTVLSAKGAASHGMAVSADGRWLLWGEWKGVGRWDLAAGRPAPRLPLPGRVIALGARSGRPELAALTDDLSLSLWDLETERRKWMTRLPSYLVQDVDTARDGEVQVAFLSNDDRVVLDVESESRYVVDARTGAFLAKVERRPNVPRGAAASEDASRFASFDRATGEVAWTDVKSRDRHVLCHTGAP
jgi:WD40 repeat protein